MNHIQEEYHHPDYPQPIKVVTGEQNVEISGNTLTDTVDYNTTLSGVSITSKPNGIIKIDGTATAGVNKGLVSIIGNTYQIPIGTNYVHYEYISGSVVSGGFIVNVRGTGNTTANQNIITSSNYSTNKYVERNITVDSTVDRVQFICSSGDSFDNLEFRVWWSRSSDTEYVPYQKQTYPLSLGNRELVRITDYKNFIFENETESMYYNADLDLNAWYVCKTIGKLVLNGSESWSSRTNRVGTKQFYTNTLISDIIASNNIKQICNYGRHNPSSYNSGVIGDFTLITTSSSKPFYLCVPDNFDLDTFKTNISNDNIILYYILGTPIYEKITDTTLIGQLENINNARSYKDTTIIECTSASTDNETIVFSGDIKVTSVGLGNSLNTSLLSNNLQNEEPLSLDNTNEDEIEEPIEEYEEL